jgi:uncharacterized RDD family membrane protein YckC
MSGPHAQAPRGEYAPPTPGQTAGNGDSSDTDAVHRIAEARAQAAAARRVHVVTGEAKPAVRDYTGLVTRGIGFGVDALIIDVAALAVTAIVALALNLFQIPSKVDTALAAIGAVAFLVWAGAYFVTFWSTTGQTPGARMMRFRVLAPGATRGRIGPRRALVRLLGMVLAALPLLAGYFIVLFDDRRRGLHDRMARTVVVDAPDTETPVRRMRTAKPPAT